MQDSGADPFGLLRMDEDQCWGFLARHRLGRVGVVRGGHPMIYPVNYRLDGHSVVFRSAPGSKLVSAEPGADVVFEVDEGSADETGSSVVVHGPMVEVTDPDERERLRGLGMPPWAHGSQDRFLRVEGRRITGRKVRVADVADGLGADGG